MSRYSLKPLPSHPDVFEVAVGWDSGFQSYFIIVFGAPDDSGEPAIVKSQGTTFDEIASVEALAALAADLAEMPDFIIDMLGRDRRAPASKAFRGKPH